MVRIFGYYVSKVLLLLAFWETVLFAASFELGVWLRFHTVTLIPPGFSPRGIAATALVFALVMVVSMTALGLYQRGLQERAAGFLVRLGLAFLFGTMTMSLLFYTIPSLHVGRGVLGLALGFAFFAVLFNRALFARFATVDARKRRVLVLGTGINASRIEDLCENDSGLEFQVIGYIPVGDRNPLVPQFKQIPRDCPMLEVALGNDVDEIVVAVDDRRRKLPVDEILDCKMSGFAVLDLLTFFEKEVALLKIDLLHPSAIIYSEGFYRSPGNVYGKRLLDLVVSLLLLVVFSPVMLLVSLASLVESGGRDPVFYHQFRVGQGGRLFRVHKFRSMRVDAEKDGVARWAQQNDRRITRLGGFLRKTRLDELPQLYNVLVGDMSLVGPRPERPEFVERLSRTIPYYNERHRVKPGVTGWAQMLYSYGASEEDAKRKLEYDLYYVKHGGLFLDLIILLQTVEVVLLGKGAR